MFYFENYKCIETHALIAQLPIRTSLNRYTHLDRQFELLVRGGSKEERQTQTP